MVLCDDVADVMERWDGRRVQLTAQTYIRTLLVNLPGQGSQVGLVIEMHREGLDVECLCLISWHRPRHYQIPLTSAIYHGTQLMISRTEAGSP